MLQTVNYSVEKTASTNYNLYQSKKLDAALRDTSAASHLKKSAGYTVRDLDNTYYLNYNIKKVAIFKNADLRRAISLAINRQALVNTVGSYNKTAQTMSSASMAIGGQNFTKYVVSQTDAADPYEFLKYMHSGQTYNFGSWNNSAYDKIVDASNSASSDKKRLQELAKAEEILAKEQGITPLFHLSQAWMIRPNVHGVVVTGSANDFKNAYATSESK